MPRIEINQGSLNTFFNGVSTFGNDTTSISQMDNILNRAGSLQGGLGQLGSAYDSLQSVRTIENNRRTAFRTNVRARTNLVISEAVNTDNDVANMLERENEYFCAVNDWARPEPELNWWQRGLRGVGNRWRRDRPHIWSMFRGAVKIGLSIALPNPTSPIGIAQGAVSVTDGLRGVWRGDPTTPNLIRDLLGDEAYAIYSVIGIISKGVYKVAINGVIYIVDVGAGIVQRQKETVPQNVMPPHVMIDFENKPSLFAPRPSPLERQPVFLQR